MTRDRVHPVGHRGSEPAARLRQALRSIGQGVEATLRRAPNGPAANGPATRRPAADHTTATPDNLGTAVWMAVVIATVSILIAIVAWRSTEADSIAASLDSSTIQQLARQQEERGHLEGIVDQDLWLFPTYQEHALAAARLMTQADQLRPAEPDLAARLDLEAQGHAVLARSLAPFFQGGTPAIDSNGASVYDRDYVLRNLEADSTVLQDLRPEGTLGAARQAHEKAAALVGLVIFFAACLLFISIGQAARPRLRAWLVVAGTLGAVGGAVLLVLVEVVFFRGSST